jgi:polyribonucleotide nucleotidyltransferase
MEGPNKQTTSTVINNGAFGSKTITFETGILAQQANGSVTVYLDNETTILSTTTVGSEPKESYDFFPLTVDVEERLYSVGRIPGSFFRREGRPTTEAILTCRLIDRPLRPLFSKEIRNEIQIIETILAVNPQDRYDVIALNAASASTLISGLPFDGPVGCVRLALIGNQWVAFPTQDQSDQAVFEIVIAGRVIGDDVAIAMIEAGATSQAWELIHDKNNLRPDEAVVTQSLEVAKPFIRQLCEAQNQLMTLAQKLPIELPLFPEYTDEIYADVESIAKDRLYQAYSIKDKQTRISEVDQIKAKVHQKLLEKYGDDQLKDIDNAFKTVSKKIVRSRILAEGYRIDGRAFDEIRPLSAQAKVLPLVHGSALFQRGETQVLGVTTLNMLNMEQKLDSLGTEETKRYMHNYNFPPYSTGETGRVGSPKRREIGHGALAERALLAVLPSRTEFPYAIRQVSEAIGSNGSTSMGSVCASTMSLLSAGVPIKAPVAGIAMGLCSGDVGGETRYVTLTDILGEEDGFGDMDFKVAGTADFITAIQLDTKLSGIPAQVLANALAQAKQARLTILNVLNATIQNPAPLADTAPKIITIKIPVDKIGEVIGPKGKVIQDLQERFHVEIGVEDDGSVFVSSIGGDGAEQARMAINEIANPRQIQVGEIFEGKVASTPVFGAFVSLTPNKDGLLHVSKMRDLVDGKRVENVEDVLRVGDTVKVKVDEIDRMGKISLSVARG